MSKPVSVVIVSFLLLLGCSTTPDNLGVKDAQLTPCPYTPNCVSSYATNKIHFVAPIYYTGTTQEAQTQLLGILKELERTKIVTVQENYIRAEFTSNIFRFVDDVEFYFPTSDKAEIVIHFRSASRIGFSDLGANQRRIEKIRDKFNALKG